MKLCSSPSSPFVRKCVLSARILGLADEMEIVTANTRDPDDAMRNENPLGKIPTLITNDGLRLFDSAVICEYLDARAGGGKLIPAGDARWNVLKLQALADGVLEAAVLKVYEHRFRTEDKVHQPWLDMQQSKIDTALDWFENNLPETGAQPTIADVTLACTLDYLDFRFDGAWREGRPNLVAWLDAFAKAVPACAETRPKD